MLQNTDLESVLQQHLGWNRARIPKHGCGFIVAFVLALVKATTVNLAKVANALGASACRESNYRRTRAFFRRLHV